MADFISEYFIEARAISEKLDRAEMNKAIEVLRSVRDAGGRLFILGSGGGAGHASHAVNDFRKIGGFEAYSPSDNVSELTARINDEGWDGCYAMWLKGSRLTDRDGLLVFSVGGGSAEKKISLNLVESMRVAKEVGAKVVGIVGPDGGYAAQVGDACVRIPVTIASLKTPLTESFQAVVWHLFVSDPRIKVNETKWESVLK